MADNETTPLMAQTSGRHPYVDEDEQKGPKRIAAAFFVIAAETFERLAWYSVSGTLFAYLTKQPLCLSDSHASAVQFMFNAVTYTCCLLGGVISDSYISRHVTIIIGYILYYLGYILLGIMSKYDDMKDSRNSSSNTFEGIKCESNVSDGDWRLSVSLIVFALFIISMAAAIVKTNLPPFGAQQVRMYGVTHSRRFMTWYFWGINLGALIAYSGFSMLEERRSFAFGYLIAFSVSLSLSFLLFLSGMKLYIKRLPESRFVVKDIFKVICNAQKVKRDNPDIKEEWLLEYSNMAKGYPGAECTFQEIRDTKNICQIFKVVLLMIPYWICYSHIIGNIYQLQGLHMSLGFPLRQPTIFPITNCTSRWQLLNSTLCDSVTNATYLEGYTSSKDSPITAAVLAIFDNIFILVFLPFAHTFYKCLTARNFVIYTYRRLVTGMIIASLSILAAGAIETVRLQNICELGVQVQFIDFTYYLAAPSLNILWQTIQYCLAGASEILFTATGLEYAYIKSPVHMQGLSMGLFWFSIGIGNFIGLALTSIFQVTNRINCGFLDVYFYALAFFLGICTFIFYKCSTYFHLGLHRMIILPLPPEERQVFSTNS